MKSTGSGRRRSVQTLVKKIEFHAFVDMVADKYKDIVPADVAKQAPPKKAPFLRMFSLADTTELLILLVGVLAAFANGSMQPLMIMLWTDMIDGLAAPESGAAVVQGADPGAIQRMMDAMMEA